MVRKAFGVLVPVAVGALVASQWKEIARYLKLRQMSAGSGDGHPQDVPAVGQHAYPGHPEADGTGQFDSASRGGGPASG